MTDPWYPPEEDGSPPIIGPGGWWERKDGTPCRYEDDVAIEALLKHDRKHQTWVAADRTYAVNQFGWSILGNMSVVAYRLANPDERERERQTPGATRQVKWYHKFPVGNAYGNLRVRLVRAGPQWVVEDHDGCR